MKKCKRDMMVVMAMCGKTKQPYGVTIEKHRNSCDLIWAFKIRPAAAKREGYDANSFRGAVNILPDFPGCPYCGSQGWYICSTCGTMVCNDTCEGSVTCPKCGVTSNLMTVDEFDLKGGQR